MHITSTQLKLLSENAFALFEHQDKVKPPQQYCTFMNTFGTGTYGGAICMQYPDFDVLKDFSDCDFWQHENAPITREQIKECVVIGNSIDGDFIAIHTNVNGYILLPRQTEAITLVPYSDENFINTLNKIGYYLYNENLENYFEPVGSNHIFLRSIHKDLYGIADQLKTAFKYDYLIENEYICEVFFVPMGGYVRFNLSYGFEVAISYNDYGIAWLQAVKKFLNENGCS